MLDQLFRPIIRIVYGPIIRIVYGRNWILSKHVDIYMTLKASISLLLTLSFFW